VCSVIHQTTPSSICKVVIIKVYMMLGVAVAASVCVHSATESSSVRKTSPSKITACLTCCTAAAVMQKLRSRGSSFSPTKLKSTADISLKDTEAADATDLYLLAKRRGSELRTAARQRRSGSISFVSIVAPAPAAESEEDAVSTSNQLRSTARSNDRRRNSDARAAAAQEQLLLQLRAAAVALLPPSTGPSEPVPGVVLSGDMLQEQAVDPSVLDSLSADIRAAHWRIEQLQQRLASPEDASKATVATTKQQLQQANAQLAKLLEHRRRLLEVAKENMHGSLASGSSSISAGLRSLQQQRRASSITAVSALFDADNEYAQQQQQLNTSLHVQHAEATELPQQRTCSGRRSSLDALSDLITELGERTDVALPAADRLKAKRRSSSSSTKAAVMAQRREQQQLDRSWQQAFKLVFPDYSSNTTTNSSSGSSSSKAAAAAAAKRWQQEEDIRLFIAASTPAQHREFIEFALDPAQSRDLPAVAKCLIARYTAGDATNNNSSSSYSSSSGGAEELVLLTADAAKLLHLLLQALRDLHADRVPAVLMLLWLLCYSAPANRALLLKEGGLGAALQRLRGAGDSNRAMQYSALALLLGTMWS
jgi:hypothetical protein